MRTTVAAVAGVLMLALVFSAPFMASAQVCLYNGNDSAWDACMNHNRQRADDSRREYEEGLRRSRENEERREQWRREELQRGEIIRRLEELGQRRGR